MKFRGKTITKDDLKSNLWLKYLCSIGRSMVNPERVESYEKMNATPVLEYVGGTLDIAEKELSTAHVSERLSKYVLETLRWSEVAKGGSESKRKMWEKQHLPLMVHNEASAKIYMEDATDAAADKKIIYTLIFTHGLIGQCLRGEVELTENLPLTKLIDDGLLKKKELRIVLTILNKAIIGAVSEDLWNRHEQKVLSIIDDVCENRLSNVDIKTRITGMFPSAFSSAEDISSADVKVFERVLPGRYLWYPEVALDSFSEEEITFFFSMIGRRIRNKSVRHISFYPMAVGLYYDYEGKKKINIYKKRIIEFCLKELMEGVSDPKCEEHVRFDFNISNETLYVNVVFTPVCEKLIDFCVEAERSSFMDYRKNITTIFDLFGFRRDIFDRLNNEDKYLETMNSTDNSRKSDLLNFVVGKSIVDVGSGGGVLLDKLEKQFPGSAIIGTDISANVIEALEHKIETEGHKYTVKKHNFVDGPFDKKVDCIIFSSILHEVYSYTEFEGEKFNPLSVKTALINAAASLKKGGRILIRDGIKTDSSRICEIQLKEQAGWKFLQNYMKDFKGLRELRTVAGKATEDVGAGNGIGTLGNMSSNHKGNESLGKKSNSREAELFAPDKVHYLGDGRLRADINFIREFMFTYTWGEESYALEVNEQFGYFTLREFKSLFEELGLKIVHLEEYLEEGYRTHLSPKVDLLGDFKWEDIPSNCIVVVEKM